MRKGDGEKGRRGDGRKGDERRGDQSDDVQASVQTFSQTLITNKEITTYAY